MYSRGLFIFLNIIYFLFNYIFITMIPNPIVAGLPLQLWCYILCPVVAAALWASYYVPFFNAQKER